MSSFDLTLEPWIPVLDAGTDLRIAPDAQVSLREIGLREALVRAHEIREVYCDSPVETIAINRLLLALFIDALSPEINPDAWIAQWDEGRFDASEIDTYLSRPDVAGRFDLLHPTHPFYQHPIIHPDSVKKEPSSLSKLFLAEASGNNATLFDHALDDLERTESLSTVARGVVSAQAASLGGGKSTPFNFSHAPLIGGAVFWLRGQSIFEALLLNAPPDANARMEIADNFGQLLKRPPIWRRDPPEEYEKRPVEGYLDYLTWPARRLTLVTIKEVNDIELASGVYITQGDKDDPLALDPMSATSYSEKKDQIFPFKLRADRVLWRDASLFFMLRSDTGARAPKTFDWLKTSARRLRRTENWSSKILYADVFGIVNDQAKMLLWRHERLPIYPDLFDHPQKLPLLRTCLSYAEQQYVSLDRATKTLSEYLLREPGAGVDEPPEADKNAVKELAQALDTGDRYWTSLEVPFFHFLGQLAAANTDVITEMQWQWAERLHRTAKNVYTEATRMLDQDARQLRAVAEGYRKIYRVTEYHNHLKTIKEETE